MTCEFCAAPVARVQASPLARTLSHPRTLTPAPHTRSGGFHNGQGAPGDADPTNTTGAELLLRWIQWGAVAPILRTHCAFAKTRAQTRSIAPPSPPCMLPHTPTATGDHCERRIWMFPYFEAMRDAMRLRNALGPYIYTEARRFFDTAVAPVHPLYYEAPLDSAVYAPAVVERVFMHGDRVLAAPITTMTGVPNGTLASWPVYLPAGRWSNWVGSKVYEGGAVVDVPYALAEVPLFVRGGILPLKTMASVAGNFPDPLVWALLPGASAGNYTVYEDDGDSDAYQGGEYVTIMGTFSGDPGAAAGPLTLTVAAAVAPGALPDGFPQARSQELQVRGLTARPTSVSVNGAPLPEGEGTPGWSIAQEHTLAQPFGSLLVRAGPLPSFSDATFVVNW